MRLKNRYSLRGETDYVLFWPRSKYFKIQRRFTKAWDYAQQGGRAGAGRVIVEGFVKFDYEITLLTVCHINGTSFLAPIGHRQEDGDYRESWQPQAMSDAALKKAQEVAEKITTALGGRGILEWKCLYVVMRSSSMKFPLAHTIPVWSH